MKVNEFPVFLAVLALLSIPAAAVGAHGSQSPTVRILQPEPAAVLAGPDVTVRVQAEGVEIGSRGRNGALVLLKLDDLPAMKSYAEQFTFRGVAAGAHRVRAELRRPDGGAFDPPVHAEVAFRVGSQPTGR